MKDDLDLINDEILDLNEEKKEDFNKNEQKDEDLKKKKFDTLNESIKDSFVI